MSDLNERPWAGWVDKLCEELFEHGLEQGLYITRNETENRVLTSYYQMDLEDKFILLGHLLSDVVVEVIARNLDRINDIAAELDEDEDDDDEEEPEEDDDV